MPGVLSDAVAMALRWMFASSRDEGDIWFPCHRSLLLLISTKHFPLHNLDLFTIFPLDDIVSITNPYPSVKHLRYSCN